MYLKEYCAVQEGRIRRTIIFDLVGPLTHPNFYCPSGNLKQVHKRVHRIYINYSEKAKKEVFFFGCRTTKDDETGKKVVRTVNFPNREEKKS